MRGRPARSAPSVWWCGNPEPRDRATVIELFASPEVAHTSGSEARTELERSSEEPKLRRVRRFFCDQDVCNSGTFVEQVAGLTERFAQRSAGLQDALVAVALALAGRAGSRVATALGMPVSRSTLLRLIRSSPDPPVGPVIVLGFDEFAGSHSTVGCPATGRSAKRRR